jgi:23S rRNA pseudouridine1911/1915/1917 synthase
MIRKYQFTVNNELIGKRLDQAIAGSLPELSRSSVKNNCKVLLVNQKKEKLSYKCKPMDLVYLELEFTDPVHIQPEAIPLRIVYEDDNYLVINKKQGMVVHPAKGHYSGTLVNALMGMKMNLSDKQDQFRPGIVHRLDKDTSGLILIAKNNHSHAYLETLFRSRKIKKRYHAIVKGFFTPGRIDLEGNIGRSPANRKKMAVVDRGGKSAFTQVKVLRHYLNYTYLNINLKTGRTHQIRVHLTHHGYPIIGDELYSRKDNRYKDIPLCLVAYRISFYDQFSGKMLDFRIKNPAHFKTLMIPVKD